MAAGTETAPADGERPEPARSEADRTGPERLEIDPAGWDDRQLCPDGACIGVIGADGRCTVCGTVDPTWSADRPHSAAPVEAAPLAAASVPSAAPAGSDEPAAWDDRQLCPDGACIGVIGADGRCTVCGAVAATASAT